MNGEVGIGNTIRHLKRGSRYRIIRHLLVNPDALVDGARMWVVETELQDGNGGRAELVPVGGRAAQGAETYRQNVVVQIDDETRKQAKRAGDAQLGVFEYVSLDYPGQAFVRPVSEFTSDRFERLGKPNQLTWLVQSLLPEEQAQLLGEWEAIRGGAPAAGTRLRSEAETYISEAGLPTGQDLLGLMGQISDALRVELGGDRPRLPHSFSPEETLAIRELSNLQDLSPAAVVRQALRMYQAHIKGYEPGPAFGCMGD